MKSRGLGQDGKWKIMFVLAQNTFNQFRKKCLESRQLLLWPITRKGTVWELQKLSNLVTLVDLHCIKRKFIQTKFALSLSLSLSFLFFFFFFFFFFAQKATNCPRYLIEKCYVSNENMSTSPSPFIILIVCKHNR